MLLTINSDCDVYSLLGILQSIVNVGPLPPPPPPPPHPPPPSSPPRQRRFLYSDYHRSCNRDSATLSTSFDVRLCLIALPLHSGVTITAYALYYPSSYLQTLIL